MKNNTLFLGLPPTSLNLLSLGVLIFTICLGVRVARAPELELQIANTQLIVGSSASKLAQLASQLDEQTKTLKQKDEAYKSLQSTYERSMKRVQEDRALSKAFEKVEKLPEVKNIEEIQQGIIQAEEKLSTVLEE